MNPIIQRINPQINDIMALMRTIKTGDISEIFKNKMNTDPQFRKFVEENKNKSVNQIADEYGLDINMIKQFIG